MKKWIFIFIPIVFLVSLCAIDLPYKIDTFGNNDQDIGKLNHDLLDIYNNMQTRNFVTYTTVPTTSDLDEGEVVTYYDTDGNYRLYSKLNGTIVYFSTASLQTNVCSRAYKSYNQSNVPSNTIVKVVLNMVYNTIPLVFVYNL